MPFFHRAFEDGLERFFLAVETYGVATEAQPFLPGEFGHRTFGRKIAAQDDEMTLALDRVVQRTDDLLSVRIRLNMGERFGHCFASDCEAIAMEQPACGISPRRNSVPEDNGASGTENPSSKGAVFPTGLRHNNSATRCRAAGVISRGNSPGGFPNEGRRTPSPIS